MGQSQSSPRCLLTCGFIHKSRRGRFVSSAHFSFILSPHHSQPWRATAEGKHAQCGITATGARCRDSMTCVYGLTAWPSRRETINSHRRLLTYGCKSWRGQRCKGQHLSVCLSLSLPCFLTKPWTLRIRLRRDRTLYQIHCCEMFFKTGSFALIMIIF